jgi:hypothetical protein
MPFLRRFVAVCVSVASTFVVLPREAVGMAIAVDALWSDWGINPTTGDWDSSVGSRIFFEDYTGTDASGRVYPGWGGQYFDVEAVYAYRTGSSLYYAIVTGFDFDGVLDHGRTYKAGDVFLDTGSGWTHGVDLQSGHLFTSVTSSNPIDFPTSGPLALTGGVDLGAVALAYSHDGLVTSTSANYSTAHYMIEGSLDLGLIGGADSTVGIHWTMDCGNDIGEGRIAPPPVPEPATLALLGIGGAAAAVARRKMKNKTKK